MWVVRWGCDFLFCEGCDTYHLGSNLQYCLDGMYFSGGGTTFMACEF